MARVFLHQPGCQTAYTKSLCTRYQAAESQSPADTPHPSLIPTFHILQASMTEILHHHWFLLRKFTAPQCLYSISYTVIRITLTYGWTERVVKQGYWYESGIDLDNIFAESHKSCNINY